MGINRHCKRNCRNHTAPSSSSSSSCYSSSSSSSSSESHDQDTTTNTKCHKCHNKNSNCHIDNCCNAIAQAMCSYFLRAPQVLDSLTVNQAFCSPESASRVLLFQGYVIEQNALVRQAFQHLFDCETDCCEGAAKAISDIGVGFVTLAYQAVLTNANTIASLPELLNTIKSGFIQSVNLILSNASCSPLV